MTSFFDNATSAVTALAPFVAAGESDDLYVQRVQHIEMPVILAVLANIAAPEFPNDLRHKACTIIGRHKYTFDPKEGRTARTMLLTTRHSDLLSDLHSLFHELARRRVPLLNTTWSDSPTQNIVTIESFETSTPEDENERRFAAAIDDDNAATGSDE
jgi:hypothetical protein